MGNSVNPQQVTKPCGQQLPCWFLSWPVAMAASLERAQGVEAVLQLLSGQVQSNGPLAVQTLLPAAQNLVIVRLKPTGMPASSVTVTESAMVVLWRTPQLLLRTRQLPMVTQEAQISLPSLLDPQLEQLASPLQLEVLVELELDLVQVELDLDLVLVGLDLVALELQELELGMVLELDMVLELELQELVLVLEVLELVLDLELDLVLVGLLELEPLELDLVLEPEPDLQLVVELVLVLVELAPAMVLVLVMELLATLAVWWLSPMEQLSQLRSQLLLMPELNILLLLLPARVNLKGQAENILHVV